MSIRARTWGSLGLPPLAWFVFEQGLSALLHAACGRAGIGVAWGVASLALCGVGSWLARPIARAPGDALVAPWLARLATAIAGIFALAIAFQTLAILIVPACVR